jgi:glucosamine-6-phosphate deaminase
MFRTPAESGTAAAQAAAVLIGEAIHNRGGARIIVGTGPSQRHFIHSLVSLPDVDWPGIEVFHMDEYVGMPDSHAASFRRWLREHLVDIAHPGQVHYMAGDSADPDGERRRYADLLSRAPVDVCFIGFGENGHIAFNDPGNADFKDPLLVKKVTLDRRCRMQQVGEGHFPNLDSVPEEAITLTCPALMSARHLICCVPELRKAEAVRNALTGPLGPQCPASLTLTHPSVGIYLDLASASLLEQA